MSRATDEEEDISDMTEIDTASSIGVIEALTRGEIDIQVRTAKAYPRSITKFRKDSQTLVTMDQETAESCMYSLPRKERGKVKYITGASVRFAELILSGWGNARAGCRPVSIEERHVVAQGVFHDLERNTAIAKETRRLIVYSDGRRYNENMIATTMAAASSIALRNAILTGIPQALWLPIYNAAKLVAIGDAKSLGERRTAAMAYFAKAGVTPERVLAAVDRAGVDDITLEDMETLIGLSTAIKGGMSPDEAFPIEKAGAEPNGGTNGKDKAANLAAQLKAEREAKGAEPPAPTQDAAPPAAEEPAKRERKGKASAPPPEPSGEPSEAEKLRIKVEECCEAFSQRELGNPYNVIELIAGEGIRKVAKIPEDKLAAVVEALTERLKAK